MRVVGCADHDASEVAADRIEHFCGNRWKRRTLGNLSNGLAGSVFVDVHHRDMFWIFDTVDVTGALGPADNRCRRC